MPAYTTQQKIRQQVIGVFREVFTDPDVDHLLQDSAVRKLKKSIKLKKQGNLKSLADVLKKYRG